MDQALKSAIEKYNGKQGIANTEKKNTFNKILMCVAVFIGIIMIFSVLVKYNLLGAQDVWVDIKGISVGEQTVGTIIKDLEKELSAVFVQNNESN